MVWVPQMANNSTTQAMFKKNIYMMDSMTDAELDGKVQKIACLGSSERAL